MIIQIVRFESALDFNEAIEIAKKRAPEFEKLTGLLQKYYTTTDGGKKIAGIYVWDNEESLKQFRASELAATIPQSYQIQGVPEFERYDVEFPLRPME